MVLIEINDEWAITERRYLSEGSMAKLYETDQNETETKEVEEAKSELLAS